MVSLRKTLLLAAAASLVTFASTAQAGLYFSEYVEGSSFNKCVEIFNGTGGDVDLSLVTINLYSNGNAAPNSSDTLSGTLSAGDVVVLCNPSMAAPPLGSIASGTVNYNGDDAFELVYDGASVDVIGQIGFDPGSTWGVAPTTTANATLRRKSTVCNGDADGSDAFDPAVEWDGFPTDTFDGLGSHDGCGTVAVEVDSWGAVKSLFD